MALPSAAHAEDPLLSERPLPQCFNPVDIQASADRQEVYVQTSFRSAQSLTNRYVLRNSRSDRWYFVADMPMSAGPHALCVMAAGDKWLGSVIPDQYRSKYGPWTVPCAQFVAYRNLRPVTAGKTVGTAISFVEATRRTLLKLPSIAREAGWSAVKVREQSDVLNAYIRALGVPNPNFCKDSVRGAAIPLPKFLDMLYSDTGEGTYRVVFDGVVNQNIKKTGQFLGVDRVIVAMVTTSGEAPIGHRALVLCLKRDGSVEILGPGYQATQP